MLTSKWEARLNSVGGAVLRYSLVFFFVAFGLYKFTPQEAANIEPLMAHSLLLSWVDPVLGVRGGSALIGVIEISIGLAMAARQFAPTISVWGSLGAVFALLNTLSFLFTTHGLDPQSSDAGFLLKDLTLLGAALWSAAEANAAARARNEGFAGTPSFSRTAEGGRAND
jgi:reactive chlorine resistance protein C